MNRLSDQSKDSIVKSLKQVFDSNSVTVCCTVLRDSIVAACANPSQLMITLIPVYAAVVAGLHFSVGTDVGAYMIESLVTLLLQHMESAKNNTRIRQHDNADVSIDQQNSADLINNKTAGNCILLLVYFYNLRILHHTLIVDLMGLLAHCASSNNCTYSSDDDNTSGNEFLELEFELLECLINHCGSSIRSDDPMSLKLVVSTLTTKLSALFKTVGGSAISADANDRGGGHIGGTSRVKFMFEALTDLKNNKSRRIQSDNADVVKHLRKWLGSMKTVLGCKAGDLCMRVSLKDILDVESRGRWWKTGARWTGSAQPPGKSKSAEEVSSSNNNNSSSSSSSRGMEGSGSVPKDNEIVDIAAAGRSGRIPSAEEVHLMGLAAKLKMNTGARKSIFLVMMSSRDVMDAFERINRIELKGKEDREIARVVTECCGQEDKYNPFYAELALLFCEHNRQFKTTFMFTFWDIFKVLADYPDNVDKKLKIRVANQSRLLATLVAKFHVPLSVIKPIDISSMGAPIISFLTHFFIALFQYEV